MPDCSYAAVGFIAYMALGFDVPSSSCTVADVPLLIANDVTHQKRRVALTQLNAWYYLDPKQY